MHFWMKRFFTAHSLMALLLNASVFLWVPIYMRNSLFDDGPYNIILKLCPTRWTRVKFFITNRECPFVHAMSTGKARADSFIWLQFTLVIFWFLGIWGSVCDWWHNWWTFSWTSWAQYSWIRRSVSGMCKVSWKLSVTFVNCTIQSTVFMIYMSFVKRGNYIIS